MRKEQFLPATKSKTTRLCSWKKWYPLIFAFILFLSVSQAYAVDLSVSGITNPAAANGTYIPNSILNGRDSWRHQSASYYIYYDEWSPGYNYWNIDTNTNDNDTALFYSEEATLLTSPIDVTSWAIDAAGTTGAPIVVESGGPSLPEINVTGNGHAIADGTIAISFGNHTNFGSVAVASGTLTRTFTIANNGAGTLNVSGVTLSGANAAEFAVTTAPSATVASTSNTTFVITFNPAGEGNRQATVSIANDDADENPYTFNISGWGFVPKNLVVSAIGSPAAANGTYLHQGAINRFQYWKHESLEYYLFNDEFSTSYYWSLDVDTDDTDTDYLFYIAGEVATPAGLTGWTANTVGGIAGNPVIVEAVAAPDIEVRGNSVIISDDDVTPSFSDHTHFGYLAVATGSRARTFTIRNTGGALMTLGGSSPYVSVSGAAAADFTVTTPPAATIPASGSTTFVVTFDPSAAGSRTATLSIASDDSDESPYTFAVQGEGYSPQDLSVSGITAPVGANGIYLHQGVLNEFQYWKHQSLDFYIYNDEYSGERYWDIDTDTNDSEVNFYSNDHLEGVSPVAVNSWTALAGSTGTPLIQYTTPEIALRQGATAIADGGSHDFGSQSLSSTTDVVITIENSGSANLTLVTPVSIGGADADQFSIQVQPASSVAGSGSTTFTMRFAPTSAGAKTATLSIANNDSDENPYDLTLTGTATAAEMGLRQGVTAIADGGNHDFGSQSLSSTTDVVITIENSGSANLMLVTPVSIGGANADQFSIQAQPASSVAGSGNTTFTVRFTPTSAGAKAATLSISNNDSDENPYDLTITGTGIGIVPAAEMDLRQGATVIVDGGSHDFGSRSINSITEVVFTIENSGSANLTLVTPVSIGGANADQFSIQAQPASSVAGLGSTTFTVRFSPTSAGAKTATISIANNDGDENPYDLSITGTGIGIVPAAEMDLRQGATVIVDGGSHDFGSRSINSITDVVFTIENSGSVSLTFVTPISISGANADQFSIQAQPTSPVAGSGNTTFAVRFTPTSEGAKTATLSIANNDGDENPYDLTITGIGTESGSNDGSGGGGGSGCFIGAVGGEGLFSAPFGALAIALLLPAGLGAARHCGRRRKMITVDN